MHLLVRADASSQLGSGHVLRSFALTDELRRRGGEVVFVCADAPGHLAEWIRARGYPVRMIPAPASPEADAQATREAVASDGAFDWLWVDHYHLDARWERAARGLARRIAAIDDMADRPHDVDLFVSTPEQNSAIGRRKSEPLWVFGMTLATRWRPGNRAPHIAGG